MNTTHKTFVASLALLSAFTLSGCSDDAQENKTTAQTVKPTLSPEEQKVVDEYIKPTTNAQGQVVEAVDPLVELLSN